MNLKIIGKRILYYRKQLKLTQEDLARRSKCTVQTICRLETGETSGNIETLGRIADSLGIPIEYLFRDHTERTAHQAKMSYEKMIKLVSKLPAYKYDALISLLEK